MPTLKTGEKISWKEAGARWKQGMKDMTAMQQSKISLFGNAFVLIGIIFGLYSTFVSATWWLFAILVGSFLLAGISTIGNYQKYVALKEVELLIKLQQQEGKNEQQSTDGA